MDADIEAIVNNRHVNPLIRQWLVAGSIGWEEMRSLMEREQEFTANLCAELGLKRFAALAEYRYPFHLDGKTVAKALRASEAWRRALWLNQFDVASEEFRRCAGVPAAAFLRATENLRAMWGRDRS